VIVLKGMMVVVGQTMGVIRILVNTVRMTLGVMVAFVLEIVASVDLSLRSV
jgi:hypothetical protein